MKKPATEQKLPKEIITCGACSRGRRVAGVKVHRVHDVWKEPDQFVWIALHEPSEEVLAQVQREFGLHDLAVEDALNAHQRPKIELYGDSVPKCRGLTSGTCTTASFASTRWWKTQGNF